MILRKGNSGRKSNGGGSIRGVPLSQIDKLKGERAHLNPGELTSDIIKQDYARVGITIDDKTANDIHTAIYNFSFLHDTDIRKAASNIAKGKPYDDFYAEKYKLLEEYCRVAPTLPSGKYHAIFRGIKMSTITPEYVQGILALKPGDKWDVDKMPTSFSTHYSKAESFSGSKGIIIHMSTKGLKHSTSIRGASRYPNENEVVVTDYNWRVSRIVDERPNYGSYHIYMEK